MKNMPTTLQRILIGNIFGIFALYFLLLTPNIVFFSFILLLFLVVIYEYAMACSKKRISPLLIALLIFLVLRGHNFWLDTNNNSQKMGVWLGEQIGIAFVLVAISYPFRKKKYRIIYLFFLGSLWLTLPFFFLIGLFLFPHPQKIFLLLVLTIIANDSFAYFIGKKWGKNKIAPKISPNKTYLGSLAGLIAGVSVTVVLEFHWQLFDYPEALLLGFCISVSAQIGDLVASKIKRTLKIKDYGKILLNQGGMLDRLDSLLFTTPVYYLIISYLI